MSHRERSDEIWTADQAFRFFESRTNLEKTTGHLRLYRIERMERIVAGLGDPHLCAPTIHIAGSKGKGSTALFVATILQHHGYRVGLYTSPHILDYRERIQVLNPGAPPRMGAPGDGKSSEPIPLPRSLALNVGPVPDDVLAQEAWKLKALVEQQSSAGVPDDDLPTTFELLTALAFLVFRRMEVDWVVLETGLGGRLDATNVCKPRASVITRIEREHTEYLGNTLAEIAGEKAGIIKKGIPVTTVPQAGDVASVLQSRAREQDAPFHILERDLPDLLGGVTPKLASIGAKQPQNGALAVRCLLELAERGDMTFDVAAAISGIEATILPGRGQVIELHGDGRKRTVVLDGAHTPESIAALVESVRNRVSQSGVLIFGATRGKAIAEMVASLAPWADYVVVTPPGSFKPSNSADVLGAFRSERRPAIYAAQPDVALQAAFETTCSISPPTPPPILVAGSFYLVAEILRAVLRYSHEHGYKISSPGW